MLSPEQKQLLAYYIRLEEENWLLDFIAIQNEGFMAPYHLKPLAKIFFRIMRGEKVKALTSVPPQHGKSVSWSNWCAYLLSINPKCRIALITYSQKLAENHSRVAKDLAIKLGVKLRRDKRGLKEWRTTANGGMNVCGRGGSITGYGYDLIIVDDPLKDRKEAESPTIKDGLEAWFGSTVYSRRSPKCSIIVNHTRWSQDDLIGRLQEKNRDWEVVNLPAVDSDGNPLWPEQYSKEFLKDVELELGEYDWNALYMGNPIPKSGVVFHDAAYYDYVELEGARLIIGCDPAATAANHADNSVIVVAAAVGIGAQQVVYIIDIWAEQVEQPDLCLKLKQVGEDYGNKVPIYIEAVGGFKGVPQTLKKMAPELLVKSWYPEATDKHTRALPLINAWNQGRVLLPKNKDWAKELVKESKVFTATTLHRKNDRIDALNICFDSINKPFATAKRGAFVM